jgi:hypothetical protein
LPHPEQFGFSFLFRNLHVPQYVPQGGTSLPFIHSSLKYQQICVIIINLGLGVITFQQNARQFVAKSISLC